jgi:hypothetical protein
MVEERLQKTVRSISGGQMGEPTVQERTGEFNQIGIDELLYLSVLVRWMVIGTVARIQLENIPRQDDGGYPE